MSLSMSNPAMQRRFITPTRFAGTPQANLSKLGFWQEVGKKATIAGNYIDQAKVVKKYGWPVNYMMLAAGTGVAGYHTWKAQPEERKKVLTRDALVLGATIGGTILASGGLVAFKQLLQPNHIPVEMKGGLKKLIMQGAKPLHDEGEKLMEFAPKNLKDWETNTKEKISKELIDDLKACLKDEKGKVLGEDFHFDKEKLKEIYDTIRQHEPKRVSEIFGKLFSNPDEGLGDEIKEAGAFFGIGALGVLSGIGGGLLANKINGEKDPEKTPNMVKEGIFQFVANIGMCAVGAGSALALMDPAEWMPEKAPETLKASAEKVTNFFRYAPGNKIYRFGGVLAGLSVGILGGAHIANYVGQHYVNPMLDKIQGKESKPPEEQGKRHIEGMDMVLHVDDIPTAAAIAGTAILGPWIMPFFPVSGYKAGIGYRNDEKSRQAKDPAPKKTPQGRDSSDLVQASGLVPQMSEAAALAFGQPFSPQYGGGFAAQAQNAFNANPFASQQQFQGAQRKQVQRAAL